MSRRLRIGIFVHEFPALSETFVLGQITGLLDLGADVEIFAHGCRQEAIAHEDVARYRLLPRTHYLAMPENRLRRLGVAIVLMMRHGRRRWRSIARSMNIVRYGREASSLTLFYWTMRLQDVGAHFDVIYCHFGPVGQSAAYLREIGAVDGTLVTVFHGVDVSLGLKQEPDAYRHLFGHGDLFLPVSQHWATRLRLHGCDPDRTVVLHMGVDLDRFEFRLRKPDGDGALRILTVGRLVEKKGVESGLRAVARARSGGANLRYTIVGDGPLRGPLEALARELDISSAVSFLGWRDQLEIARQMYANDVLVAPSVTDRAGDQEGIPVTLMEAMATGMAVVSTRHSGIPELVREGAGILVEEGDVEGLAAALRSLEADAALRESLGREARAMVAADFDMKQLNERLWRIFQKLSPADRGDGTSKAIAPALSRPGRS